MKHASALLLCESGIAQHRFANAMHHSAARSPRNEHARGKLQSAKRCFEMHAQTNLGFQVPIRKSKSKAEKGEDKHTTTKHARCGQVGTFFVFSKIRANLDFGTLNSSTYQAES